MGGGGVENYRAKKKENFRLLGGGHQSPPGPRISGPEPGLHQ